MGAIDSHHLPTDASVANNLIANIRLSKKLRLRNKMLIGDIRQLRLECQMIRRRSRRLLNQSRIVAAEFTEKGQQALAALATVAHTVFICCIDFS